jgi:ribonuclease P protein component
VALNRAVRLRKNSDFQRVRQQGQSVPSRLLVLTWMPNGEVCSRVGIVVSKRTARHAVDRNRTKRRLGEAVRPFLEQLAGRYDVVLSARSAAVAADFPVLRQEVITLLRRARLLKPDQILL